MAISAKLQSYMAREKAIIASDSDETKRIIQEAECGICCEIGNTQALAEGIRELIGSILERTLKKETHGSDG